MKYFFTYQRHRIRLQSHNVYTRVRLSCNILFGRSSGQCFSLPSFHKLLQPRWIVKPINRNRCDVINQSQKKKNNLDPLRRGAKWLIEPSLNSGFCSVKWMRVCRLYCMKIKKPSKSFTSQVAHRAGAHLRFL